MEKLNELIKYYENKTAVSYVEEIMYQNVAANLKEAREEIQEEINKAINLEEVETTLDHLLLLGKKTKAVSDLEGKSQLARLGKAIEELGEVAQQVLIDEGVPSSAYKGEINKYKTSEECIDTIMVLISIIQECGICDLDGALEIYERKLLKWESKLEEEKNNESKN